jgi:hypothetical protein
MSFYEGTEDLKGAKDQKMIPAVIFLDLGQFDKAAFNGHRKPKGCQRILRLQILIVCVAVNLCPTIPVQRNLDNPRLEKEARATSKTVMGRPDANLVKIPANPLIWL